MTVTRIKTTSGWQDVSVPTRSGIINVQKQVGNNNNYVTTPANGVALKRDASNDLQLVYTPPVDCYWETEGHSGRIQKVDSAWHYLAVDLRLSPADADGKTTSPDYIVELHKDGTEYAVVRPKERWRLTAGVTYTLKMHKSEQEGGTYNYYQGASHLWLSGMAFIVDPIYSTMPGPATVTALPSNPVNGQEVFFQSAAMATDGIAWHLRYNAASASAYKWEYVGGPGIEARDDTDRVFTSTGAWSNTSTLLQITTPLAGDWEVYTTVLSHSVTVGGQFGVGVGIGATAPAVFGQQAHGYTPTNMAATFQQHGRVVAQPSGTLLRHYCYGPASTDVHPRGRMIRATPVRVG